VAWSLRPAAAGLTGTLKLVYDSGNGVVTWATRLVFSPVVWAGIALAGVSVVLFVVSGASAALFGLIMAWQLGAGLPAAAVGLEITVVSAVLLGGGHLAGGAGSVAGTLLVLLVISIVGNGLALANVNPYVGPVLSAALLIIALVIDRPRRR
jgi:ribose transport system permease protein